MNIGARFYLVLERSSVKEIACGYELGSVNIFSSSSDSRLQTPAKVPVKGTGILIHSFSAAPAQIETGGLVGSNGLDQPWISPGFWAK